MNTDDRLVEIEIKISRQEDMLESLNQVVYQQQKKIDHLEAICAALAKHIKQTPEADGQRTLNDERPPHY
jgi:SlyX protein